MKQRTFQFAPREMVIRLNGLNSAELSFAEGIIMSAAGSSDQDTLPIRKLLRQFFDQTLLKRIRTRGHKWFIGRSHSRHRQTSTLLRSLKASARRLKVYALDLNPKKSQPRQHLSCVIECMFKLFYVDSGE